ncbi:hypothetical protein ACHAWC_000876, partial [Mediolabrus comicus]
MAKTWLTTTTISLTLLLSRYSSGCAKQVVAFAPNNLHSKFIVSSGHHSRGIHSLLPFQSPTAPRWKNTMLNARTKEEERSKYYSEEDTLDVLNDENINTMITSSPPSKRIDSNSPADISLLGIPLRSIILLNVVAIIWGTQHSVIKSVVDDSVINFGSDAFTSWAEHILGSNWDVFISTIQDSRIDNDDGITNDEAAAAYFTLARFSLAALLASPYTPGLIRQKQVVHDDTIVQNEQSTKLAWKYGIELGIYMFLGYAFQAIGLQTTTASRSGFLLYLNVKLVPFFSYFIFGKTIQRSTWISALIAFSGTALLALDNANSGTGGLDATLTVGDLWSIAAAAASALFILRMEAASKSVPNSAELNSANLWTVAFLSFLWTNWISFNSLMHGDTNLILQETFQQTIYTILHNPIQLIYLSAVTTALANYIQSIAQKEVSAERASIFYALDPVYGAFFANLLLGETLGLWGWVGATLIAFAAATNAIWDFS